MRDAESRYPKAELSATIVSELAVAVCIAVLVILPVCVLNAAVTLAAMRT